MIASRSLPAEEMVRANRTCSSDRLPGLLSDRIFARISAELSGVRPMIETYPLERAAEAYARMARAANPYGDGRAAPRIGAWLLARLRGGSFPAAFDAALL